MGALTPIFMFPGQSSRDPAMLNRVMDVWPGARAIVDRSSEHLGRNLLEIIHSDGAFESNQTVQVAVFLTSYLYCEALRERNITAHYSLGLSLGEYNHLVHIGAIDFFDALTLVDQRGQCYDASPTGKMVAVMPLDTEELEESLSLFEADGIVEIANYNSPTQHVIAGNSKDVDRIVEFLEEAMAMCFEVDSAIPMHTQLMKPVADAFQKILVKVNWQVPHGNYLPGVKPGVALSTTKDIPELLKQHVQRPVYFYESLRNLVDGIDSAILVEVGPHETLYNLTRRCFDIAVLRCDDTDNHINNFEDVVKRLQAIGSK